MPAPLTSRSRSQAEGFIVSQFLDEKFYPNWLHDRHIVIDLKVKITFLELSVHDGQAPVQASYTV